MPFDTLQGQFPPTRFLIFGVEGELYESSREHEEEVGVNGCRNPVENYRTRNKDNQEYKGKSHFTTGLLKSSENHPAVNRKVKPATESSTAPYPSPEDSKVPKITIIFISNCATSLVSNECKASYLEF